jgi:Rrf2 family nitric oxide-sensitive transcriptional repressor
MYLAIGRDNPVPATIPEIAERFELSRNHLVKVVHFMAQHGLVHTTRGKGGGLRLGRSAGELSVGGIVRLLEPGHDLIDCETQPCALRSGCRLKGALRRAEAAFYAVLDKVTLAEMIEGETGAAIIKLHQL